MVPAARAGEPGSAAWRRPALQRPGHSVFRAARPGPGRARLRCVGRRTRGSREHPAGRVGPADRRGASRANAAAGRPRTRGGRGSVARIPLTLRLRAWFWIAAWWLAWQPRRHPRRAGAVAIAIPALAGVLLALLVTPPAACHLRAAASPGKPHFECVQASRP